MYLWLLRNLRIRYLLKNFNIFKGTEPSILMSQTVSVAIVLYINLSEVGDFLRVLRFPPSITRTPWYSYNIVESGVKHHKLNPLFRHIWFPIILSTLVGILQYFKLFLYKIKAWHVKRRGFEIIYLCYLLFCWRDIKSKIMWRGSRPSVGPCKNLYKHRKFIHCENDVW